MAKLADFLYGVLNAIGYTHPLHPVLTHLVIGPVVAAFILGLIGWLGKKESLLSAARILNVFAFCAWFLTVPLGILDWEHFYQGQLIHAIVMKMIFASILFVLLLVTLLVNRRLRDDPRIPVALYFLSTIDVGVLGYFGGSLVFG